MRRTTLVVSIALVGLLAGCDDPVEQKEKAARAASIQAERAWKKAEVTARENAAATDDATRLARQRSEEADAKLIEASLELRRAVEKDLDGIDDRAAKLAMDAAGEKNAAVRTEAERRIRALQDHSRDVREAAQTFKPADPDHLASFRKTMVDDLRAMRKELDEIGDKL